MAELFTNFGVDWKLLLAQVVNFFLLLVILRIFAYKPILKMLKARKDEIKKGLDSSAESQKHLAYIEEFKKQKIDETNKNALGIVNKAEDTAKKRQDEILGGTRKKAEVLVAGAKKLIEQEKEKRNKEVRDSAEELVRAATVKVLSKMNSSERDGELIKQALGELRNVEVS